MTPCCAEAACLRHRQKVPIASAALMRSAAKSTVSQPAEFGEKGVGATARIRGPILGLRKVRGIVETQPDFGEAMRGAGVEDHLALSLESSSAPAEVILRCR